MTELIERDAKPFIAPARSDERMSFDHLGYNLGWDFAFHGIKPPSSDDPSVMRGYAQGHTHFGRQTIETDLFVRKWLQIRFNALSRHRVFDDAVTPNFIASICTRLCPITRVPMTVKTCSGSDWSVDRIINDGGYSPANLMIMSTHANRVKSDKSLDDIGRIMMEPELDTRLKPFEWLRLFAITQAAYMHAGLLPFGSYKVMPLVAFSPPHIPAPWPEKLQLCFLTLAMQKGSILKLSKNGGAYDFFRTVKSTCDDKMSAALYHKIIARMRRKAPSVRLVSDLWWDRATMSVLLALIDHQTKRGIWPRVLTTSIDRFRDADDESRICSLHNDMGLASGGYHFS